MIMERGGVRDVDGLGEIRIVVGGRGTRVVVGEMSGLDGSSVGSSRMPM
jgi:hypothetical protein